MQRNGISFKGQNIFIGIDVHLKTWAVAIMTESGMIERFSQASDAGILATHLKRKYPGGTYYSAYESGFCGFSAHYSLVEYGINNRIVNAADVPTTQKETVGKSDPVDAKKLAKSLLSGSLAGIHIPDRERVSDRDLVRVRSQIVKDQSRWKQRIKHLLYCHGVKYPEQFIKPDSHWSKRFIRWLEEEVVLLSDGKKEPLLQQVAAYKEVRKRLLETTLKIRKLSQTDFYAANMELLSSIPGIGFHTSITFLTEIGDIHRFSNEREFASFIGIVPICYSSGEKENVGEMTFRGNKHLRSMLIESSWTAIRRDAALAACYGNYCKHMDENDAIIRIARKLSNRILTVLKRKTKYVRHEK
jgi:transposase